MEQGQLQQHKVDDLVVIKEDHTPRLYGPLGRVTTVHPGQHGFIRAVTVKTAHDVINRTVTKTCVLPPNSYTNV